MDWIDAFLRSLLLGLGESLDVSADGVVCVAGEFITPNGNQVYPVQFHGGRRYVTIPEQ